MPYELSFKKRLPAVDRGQYINECCVGGDVVVDQLLPAVRSRYADIETNQEDWGWFIWFRDGDVRLAIDVFTDDPDEAAFRVHLVSRMKRLIVRDKVVDTPELEQLKTLVVSTLQPWVDGPIDIVRLDEKEIM